MNRELNKLIEFYKVLATGETIHNMAFEVTADDLYAAILGADSLGRLYK